MLPGLVRAFGGSDDASQLLHLEHGGSMGQDIYNPL